MADPRQAAIDEAAEGLHAWMYGGDVTADSRKRAAALAEVAVDSIRPGTSGRLAVERGGMEQVGWVQPNPSPVAEHPLRLGRHWPGAIDQSRWVGWSPVYQLSEEAPTDG